MGGKWVGRRDEWREDRRGEDGAAAVAPIPSGEQVAAFRRTGYRGGKDTELRVSLDVVGGNPFISLRVWEAGAGGAWWPTPKGVTIKVKEADGVGAALVYALSLADDDAIRRIAAHNEAITGGQKIGKRGIEC